MKHFITFSAGSSDYYAAGNRLVKQAKALNIFDEIQLYTDADLKSDVEFWEKHGAFIESNPRGYGYWLWKPYLIKREIEKLSTGDYLMYLDSGCEIDQRKSHKFNYFFEIAKLDMLVGTLALLEKEWTKMDLVSKLGMKDSYEVDTRQHQAGALLIWVCDVTREIVNQWYDLACDYHNIDDSPSIEPNLSCFKEHRHDQSIFSLLTKKHGFYSKTILDCIEYTRNRTGNTRL